MRELVGEIGLWMRWARRASVVFAAAASMVTGLVLVWAIMPDRVGMLETCHLVCVVGLFALPAFTLGSLELHRRALRAQPPAIEAAPRPIAARAEPAHARAPRAHRARARARV